MPQPLNAVVRRSRPPVRLSDVEIADRAEVAAAQDRLQPRSEAVQTEVMREPEPQRQRPEPGAGARRDLPPADFTMLVNMLVTNAMVFLGQMPAPGSQQYMRNLPQAQHMVDLLMVLREKTRGNLTSDEDQMMQDLLPQLQMAYVSASQQVG